MYLMIAGQTHQSVADILSIAAMCLFHFCKFHDKRMNITKVHIFWHISPSCEKKKHFFVTSDSIISRTVELTR